MYLPVAVNKRLSMRQTIIAAAAAFVIGGAVTGAVLSQAQPAPPPVGVSAPPAPPAGPQPWMHHPWMHPGMHHGWQRPFALIYRAPDRNISPADVQTIVEGVLLWNGNHSWKVADIAPNQDGTIGFSLTTATGAEIAKFTIDPHTGHIQRVG